MGSARRRLIVVTAVVGGSVLLATPGCGSSDTTGGGTGGTMAESCTLEGEVESCYSGPLSTLDFGECHAGSRTCEGGVWGECTGEVGPIDEICGDLRDNDCNGTKDDGCPCVSGDVQPCYEGPESMHGIGICQDGEQLCVDEAWSVDCVGDGLPLDAEACNGQDDNCDGLTDEGCVCTPAGSYCAEDGSFLPCPAGTYQPEPAQESCIDSGVGSYAAGPGATTTTLCPAGGYYCPNAANAAPTACPAGRYTNTEGGAGATTCTECPSGDYCRGDGDRHGCSDGMGAPPGSDSSSDCGCHMRLTICDADCGNFPSGCAYGSTQWMEGAKPNESYCIPDTDWGHGRETVDCDY